jgi:hypothetical protein
MMNDGFGAAATASENRASRRFSACEELAMASATFDEVLDAIEHLPIEQQADLVDVVRRRLAERGRRQIIADAREEFTAGRTRGTPIDDLIREITS